MLEQITLSQVIVWLLMGGGIAVALERLAPGWKTWQSPVKAWIVTLLNLIGPYILAAIKSNPVVAGQWEQTIANLVIGLVMAAVSFVMHAVDEWLTAKAQAAKAVTRVWAVTKGDTLTTAL